MCHAPPIQAPSAATIRHGWGEMPNIMTRRQIFPEGGPRHLFILHCVWPHFSCSTGYESAPVKKVNAAAPPLTVGATGKLLGWDYHISAHAVVEIAEVGARFERHEYPVAR